MNTDSPAAPRLRGIWMGVADLARSRAFYERLDARFDEARQTESMAVATLGGTMLGVEEAPDGRSNGGPAPFFDVADADALHADLLAAGFEVEGPPADEPWGRQFNVRDPNGHLIAFVGPVQ